MRRRALLATAAAVSTTSLAGCPTPPWGEIPETIDGAEVTFRREHTGEFDPGDSDAFDAAELRRELDREPPRLLVRGRTMGGVQDCYRVSLIEATRSADLLSIRIAIEKRPLITACNDAAESHPYEVAVAFTEPPVPERVEVRHGEDTVLAETVSVTRDLGSRVHK
ncbi:hypothetical protein CK500_10660 [Halorubrum salipaludis]|uniref:Lipoprotein n=1 Tax=Halorubrum salipaludis TaxID=2032630 RepID=A0A2A2FF74_9EURY|nr:MULTISPECIES: hypothetical protein [Halorubrum]PAU83249.1 hypothetical protein CK500_10660 [Halorubrum salipaludis]